jgi:hypothetical protein
VSFTLLLTREAASGLSLLETKPQLVGRLQRVRTALGRLQLNPDDPALRSHKYVSLAGKKGEAVWDSYIEHQTPTAGRIYWHYGPGLDRITVVSITPHR